MRDSKVCISCGIKHNSVEAGGIWYCPNPVCKVCGANWFKKEFVKIENGEEYYDFMEVAEAALEWTKTCKDKVIVQAVLSTIKKYIPDFFSNQIEISGGCGEGEL